jgi:WW domain-binding protein 4
VRRGNKTWRKRSEKWLGLRRCPFFCADRRVTDAIIQAAQAAFARDVGAGLAKGSGDAPRTSSSRAAALAENRKPAAKPSSPWANYSTAESLGYADPDAERAKAEAERRMSQGVAGDWQLVEPTNPAAPSEEPVASITQIAGLKRDAGVLGEEDEAREFQLRKKTVGTGLGQLYDPGVIPIKLKAKKEEPVSEDTKIASGDTSEAGGVHGKLKWSARGWKRPGEPDEDTTIHHQEASASSVMPSEIIPKAEEGATDIKHKDVTPKVEDVADDTKQEDFTLKIEESEAKPALSSEVSEAPVMFRKRKIPAGGSRGRRT